MKKDDLYSFLREERDQHSDSELPLSGIRIIDMASVIAAPYAATLLGDFGAEVIKIENPNQPDAIRSWGVIEDKGIAPFWSVVGRNKYPVTLNLKSAAGRDVFLEMIKRSDVLIENLRPGAMDKLGISKEKLLQENPGLIIGTVSGYGATGPNSQRPGFGTLAEGFSGYTYLNAQPGGTPTNAPFALADFVAGSHLAFGIMVALRKQKRGESGGQCIDISLYEPLFSMLGPDYLSYHLTGEIPQPKGNELSYAAPRNNYLTRDNRWVTLSCTAQQPFERLMNCVGRPEMLVDPRFQTNEMRIKKENRTIINDVIATWVASLDLNQVLSIGDEMGITVGPITTMQDIARDRHYRERLTIVDIVDPTTGLTIKVPNLVFRLLSTPGKIRFPGLPKGAANTFVYHDLMGFSHKQVNEMAASGLL